MPRGRQHRLCRLGRPCRQCGLSGSGRRYPPSMVRVAGAAGADGGCPAFLGARSRWVHPSQMMFDWVIRNGIVRPLGPHESGGGDGRANGAWQQSPPRI